MKHFFVIMSLLLQTTAFSKSFYEYCIGEKSISEELTVWVTMYKVGVRPYYDEYHCKDAADALNETNFLSLYSSPFDPARDPITDLSPISESLNLSEISLSKNNIADLSPLTNLKNLRIVQAYQNQISDISSLQNLSALEELGLANNLIEDPAPLSKITSLVELNIANNRIQSVDSLSNLKDLEVLYLGGNCIQTFSAEFLKLQETHLNSQQRDIKLVIKGLDEQRNHCD